MKIAWFHKNISPEIGAKLAGYGLNDVSTNKLDDLCMSGLCMDDGSHKALLVSLDLLGLDQDRIMRLRKIAADLLQIDISAVLLSCTHTHQGPETRFMSGHPEQLDRAYLDQLERWLAESVRSLTEFHDCELFYYSSQCNANRNRRYVTADRHASFLPYRREMRNADAGFADQELIQLCFMDPAQPAVPIYVIGNYAAHPLAAHSPGRGGVRISADFPGAFRDYIRQETGAECMFISGAAGNLVPEGDELGSDAARQVGIKIGKAALGGMIDSVRNARRFRIPDPHLASASVFLRAPLRKQFCNDPDLPPAYHNKSAIDLELQLLAVGDLCFVGVPVELCCELGQEIKWHSPFLHTCIAYNSTGYFDYLGHTGMLIEGGYEGRNQKFVSRTGLELVNAAVNGLFDLREMVFPSEEPYPDSLEHPLVDIPVN